jgi:hypothetical protein
MGIVLSAFRTTERVIMRKERDHRVGVIVDVEHPGDSRWARRRRGITNNPSAQRRAEKRAEAAKQEALDNAEAPVVE